MHSLKMLVGSFAKHLKVMFCCSIFAGEVNHLEREEIKSDFNLMGVDGRVVPEYMRSMDPLGSPGVPDLVDQCSSAAMQNEHQSDAEQTSPSISKPGCTRMTLFLFLSYQANCFHFMNERGQIFLLPQDVMPLYRIAPPLCSLSSNKSNYWCLQVHTSWVGKIG